MTLLYKRYGQFILLFSTIQSCTTIRHALMQYDLRQSKMIISVSQNNRFMILETQVIQFEPASYLFTCLYSLGPWNYKPSFYLFCPIELNLFKQVTM